MRRRLRLAALLAVAALALAACGGGGAGGKGDVTVRVGTQPGVFVAPYFIASERGLFPPGLKIKETSFLSGPDMVSALVAGQLDVGYLGGSPAILAASRNRDIVIVGIDDLSNGGEGIVVQPDEGIRTLADLRGKTIGVALGSTTHRFLIEQLRQAGLDPSKDVDIRDMTTDDQLAAFQAHQVDAVVNWEPWKGKAVAAGGIELVNDAKATIRTYDVIVANRKFAAAHPDALARFLLAHYQGAAFRQQHPDEAADLVIKHVDVARDEVLKTFALYEHPDLDQVLSPDYLGGGQEGTAYKSIVYDVGFLAEQGVIETRPDAGRLIDTEWLQQAAELAKPSTNSQ